MIISTKMYLGIASALCLVAASSWWWVYAEISAARTTMTSSLTQIASVQGERSSSATLSTLMAATAEERGAIANLYLRRDDVISFLTTIESFASSGVTIDVQTLEEVTDGTSERLEIPLIITGPAPATRSTLNTLESLPYASYIDDLNLAITPMAGRAAEYQAAVTLIVALQPTSP